MNILYIVHLCKNLAGGSSSWITSLDNSKSSYFTVDSGGNIMKLISWEEIVCVKCDSRYIYEENIYII